jgi:hypothetical protein
MTPIVKTIDTEEPQQHWQYLTVKQQRVLNLGCGNFGILKNMPYPDDVGYFLAQDPAHLVAVDTNPKDVALLQERYAADITAGRLTVRHLHCDRVSVLQELLDTYQITAVKSDIEGFEFLFEWLPEEYVTRIQHWAIEAHGNNLIQSIKQWSERYKMTCTAEIVLTHGMYPCRVYFFTV